MGAGMKLYPLRLPDKMKRWKNAIRALRAIAANPWLLNKVLEDDDKGWQERVERRFGYSAGLPLLDLGTLFPGFEVTLEPIAFLDGGSPPMDIGLLVSLAKSIRDCSYFEIGSWRGESVTNVARVAKEAYTLNLSKEEIILRGWGADHAAIQGYFSKDLPNVHHLYGDSRTFDYAGLGKKFDLVFIDGSHHFDYVKNDTAKVFEHLLHDKSIVVWHDYAYAPEQIRPEVLAGILEGVPRNLHRYLYYVSNTMCAVFIREDFPTSTLKYPSEPNKHFRVKVELVHRE